MNNELVVVVHSALGGSLDLSNRNLSLETYGKRFLTLLLDVAQVQIRQNEMSVLLHSESVVLGDLCRKNDLLYWK